MTQTVLDNFIFKSFKRKFFVTFIGIIAASAAMAQTYTTKADGAWNNAATWVGGIIPANPIGAGKVVVIKHDVTFDLSADLSITGTLHVEGDTLRFPTTYNKKVLVAAAGILNVKNGGFIHSVTLGGTAMEVSGRVSLENAKLSLPLYMKALPGARRSYKNSTVLVGGAYDVEGTSASRTYDTIQASTVSIASRTQGDFTVKAYSTILVANAKVIVDKKGSFVTAANAEVKVLAGAAGNYGFNQLKIDENLENVGAWDARIDAFCIGKDIKGNNSADVDFTRPEDCSEQNGAPAPELSFIAPVLKSGTANKEGAVYRFSNITTGIDAEIKLKKFSRSDIKMNTIDNSALGWNKAFQPEFGLAGVVPANQNWYIDFEMTFYEAGTNKKKKVDKADFTALDVDGDGWSISEYAVFSNPANVAYSPASSLSTVPAGTLGSSITCGTCNIPSLLIQCLLCQGTGEVNDVPCGGCAANGVLHSLCSHPYEGMIGNVLQGPVQNYNNIDTNGTAVMATYQYSNVDRVNFRYGAKSGAYSANGSGIRLNSMWSKSFALTPWTALPVNFSSFGVIYQKGDAAISWKATHGEELKKFLVQRSTDGKNFNDIATVFAGNTLNYSYTDPNISSNTGVVYYRVASIDHTGDILYTSVKMIRLTKNDQQTLALSTFPNPVVNDVRITLPQAWQGKPVVLQLITTNGTIAKTIQLGAASQTETMSVSNLLKGMYVVKAICGEEAAQQRIIKN
ncbi:MAG TPA: T9SS type A sorting domain-containing protein [Flavisolibacter sp.]